MHPAPSTGQTEHFSRKRKMMKKMFTELYQALPHCPKFALLVSKAIYSAPACQLVISSNHTFTMIL